MKFHHQNIKQNEETNPTRFLDPVFNANPDSSVTTEVFQNPENFQPFGTLNT